MNVAQPSSSQPEGAPPLPADVSTDKPAPSLSIDEVYEQREARLAKAEAAQQGAPEGQGEDAEAAAEDDTQQDSPEVDPSDTDADEDDPPEDEAEETDEDQVTHRIVVDGQEMEVTTAELVRGYQLEKASRTRMDKAAAQLRAVEEQRQAIESERTTISEAKKFYAESAQRYATLVDRLSHAVKTEGAEFDRINWDKLDEEDPVEAGRQWRRYQQHQAKMQAVAAEQRRLEGEKHQETAQAAEAARQNLVKGLQVTFPQWADQSVRERDTRAMEAYLTEIGIPVQMLATDPNPAVWRMVHDAASSRRARTDAAAIKQPKPVAKPGAPQPIKMVRPDAARPTPVRTARATEMSALNRKIESTGDIDAIFERQQLRKQIAARR